MAIRAEIRRAYRCPCDGRSHREPGRAVTRRSEAIAGELDLVEQTTGDRPHACPWYSFHEPDVRQVLDAFDFDESGQLREWYGDDPPYWLVLGVQHYRRVLGRVRLESHCLEREARKADRGAKRAQLPPGYVVEGEIRG